MKSALNVCKDGLNMYRGKLKIDFSYKEATTLYGILFTLTNIFFGLGYFIAGYMCKYVDYHWCMIAGVVWLLPYTYWMGSHFEAIASAGSDHNQ